MKISETNTIIDLPIKGKTTLHRNVNKPVQPCKTPAFNKEMVIDDIHYSDVGILGNILKEHNNDKI